MRREFERVVCPCCGRVIAAYVPHMGDGSGLRTMKHSTHRKPASPECRASQRIIVSRNGEWQLENAVHV